MTLSRTAQIILNYVHRELEKNRTVPSRQQVAEAVGFKDKKSLIPYMEELYKAGWRQPGSGHRSDDWGGRYIPPDSPPFSPINSSGRFVPKVPQMGEFQPDFLAVLGVD